MIHDVLITNKIDCVSVSTLTLKFGWRNQPQLVGVVVAARMPVKRHKRDIFTWLYNNHKNFRLAWIVICIVGNVWQAWLILATYFSYEIVTTLSIGYPSKFEAPSITICFYVVNTVRVQF